VISQKRQVAETRLLRTHLAMRHVTGVVVVFHDADGAALVWIALDDRESAVGAKRLDGFRSAIIVVVANLAHQDAVQVLLNKVDLPVEVAVALDLNNLVAFDGLDQIRFPVSVTIDPDLVFVFADPLHPLVGPSIGAAMCDDAVRASVAGEKCES